jgi:hypothetical protein
MDTSIENSSYLDSNYNVEIFRREVCFGDLEETALQRPMLKDYSWV